MPLFKHSKSRSSSTNASPVSTPRAYESTTSRSPTPTTPSLPPDSPLGSHKSPWPEKQKYLALRLPSLPRRRSRSKSELALGVSDNQGLPSALQSPLRKPSSKKNLLEVDCSSPGAAQSSGAIGAQDGKHIASYGSSSDKTSDLLEEEIKLVFKKFDTNNDGKISAEELCCVLKSLGDNATEEEAELMIAEVDMDKDGCIDLQEFMDLNICSRGGGANGEPSNTTDELAAAFDMFDLDKNGCITPDELHCVLGNLGNHTSTLEDCKRMIRGVDRKGSGHVDFDDFKVMMTSSTTTVMA